MVKGVLISRYNLLVPYKFREPHRHETVVIMAMYKVYERCQPSQEDRVSSLNEPTKQSNVS